MNLRFCLALPLLALALALSPACVAGEERASPEEVATRVAAAARAQDEAAFKRLARGDDPDPWLVAEVLDARGERLLARRFAEAVPREETKPLCRYLTRAPGRKAQEPQRKLLTAARAAHAKEDHDEALRLLEGMSGPATTVAAVEGLYLLGVVQADLRRPPAGSYAKAAKAAEDLAWLSMACRAHVAGGRALFAQRDYVDAHTAFLRLLDAEELIGSRMGQGRAHYMLSLTSTRTKRSKEAEAYLDDARRLADESEDHEYVAKILKEETVGSDGTREEKYAAFRRAAHTLGLVTAEGLATRFQPDPVRLLRTRVDLLLDCASAAQDLGEEDWSRDHADAARELAADAGNEELRLRTEAFKGTLEAVALERRAMDLEAAEALRRVVVLYARLAPGWLPQAVRELRRLAAIQLRLGRFEQADTSLQQALSYLQQAPSASELCSVLVLSAKVDLNLGRSDAALQKLARLDAMDVVRSDCKLQVYVLSLRAEHQKRLGSYAKAREFLRRARALCAGLQRPADLGLIDLRIAQLARVMGREDLALKSLALAIEELENSEYTHALRQARGLRARLLSETGHAEGALVDLRVLLEEHRSYGDEVGVARTQQAMADVYFRQVRSLPDGVAREKQLVEALRLRELAYRGYSGAGAARKAAVIRSQLGRELLVAGRGKEGRAHLHGAFDDCKDRGDVSGQATCSLGLAEAYRVQPDYPEAIKQARVGLELASDFGLDLAEGEGEEGRARRLMALVRIGSKAAYKLKSAADLYEFFDRGRAAGLLAALGGREALRTVRVSQRLRKKEDEARAAVGHALEARSALGRHASFPDSQKASLAVRGAQELVRQATVAIRQEVRMQADLAYPQVPPLAEVRGRLKESDAFILYGEVFDKIVAVIVTKDREPRLVDLAKGDQVRAAVEDFLEDDEYDIDEKLTGPLRKLLLDKLALGAEVKRLLISPHGSLAYVPFSLLDREREICFLPSATVFATLRAQTVQRGEHIFALGYPDYSGTGHQDLPETLVEVKSIADKDRGDTVRLREEASETVFKRLLAEKEEKQERWRAVHLACHGIVDRDNPRESSLELTPGEGNDGTLEALEVFSLRVPADLVVLSGCETGGGRIIEGEGLEGLTRAFLFAGTPRVIASLWDVDDEATQALMSEFYRLWDPRAKPGDPERAKRVERVTPTKPGSGAPTKPDSPTPAKPGSPAPAPPRSPEQPKSAEGAASKGGRPNAPDPGLSCAAALKQAQAFVRDHPEHPLWKHPHYWAAWVIWGLPD